MALRLTCENGDLRGQSWTVRGVPLSIGRGLHCDVVVPDRAASREHCTLIDENGCVYVTDSQSANGTFVNEEPVTRGEVRPGDALRIGQTRFIVSVGEAIPPSADPVNASDSIHRSETESILLKEHLDASAFEGNPDSIVDLASISSLGRELSQARTREAVTNTLTKRLRRHLNPSAIFLMETGSAKAAEQALYTRTGYTPLSEPQRRRVAESVLGHPDGSPGALEAVPRSPEPTWLAVTPVTVGGDVIAVLAVELGVEAPYSIDRVLDFLIAVSATAGPFFHAVKLLDHLRSDNKRLAARGGSEPVFVGESRSVLRLKEDIRLAAETDLSVLIQGETGTGKELVASLLHSESQRQGRKFVPVNCAAIAQELFASEFFGHVRGGFTGADSSRSGFVEVADGGTLFLDEFTELSLQHQAALLRFLESRTYNPVGSTEERHSDARVVVATNRDPLKLIGEGTLRADLYHRIASVTLRIPPLRERPEDIPQLSEHFFNRGLRNARRPLLGLTADALALLSEQAWMGNARELRNVIDRAVAFATEEWITADQLGEHLPIVGGGASRGDLCERTLEAVERRHIERVYEECERNVVRTAEVLGVGKTTLYEKLDKYGIRRRRSAKA